MRILFTKGSIVAVEKTFQRPDITISVNSEIRNENSYFKLYHSLKVNNTAHDNQFLKIRKKILSTGKSMNTNLFKDMSTFGKFPSFVMSSCQIQQK